MKSFIRRQKYLDSAEDDFVRHLLTNVWQYKTTARIGLVGDVEKLALRNHAKATLRLLRPPVFMPSRVKVWSIELQKVASSLQPLASGQIMTLNQRIGHLAPLWLAKPSDTDSQQHFLSWFIEFWLFVKVKIDDPDQTLPAIIAANLPQRGLMPLPGSGLLSDDFCAKSLTRKAAFELCFTSNLAEHLTFKKASKKSLCIFRHSQMLEHFRISDVNAIFPPGFLEETRKTLSLLFPVLKNVKTQKRVRRIQVEEEVDIEALIGDFELMDTKSYPYYASRLIEIQRRYDASRPKKAKQWWFDRRHRLEWTTLGVAVVVFVLTVVFGVIQSVTSILQVSK